MLELEPRETPALYVVTLTTDTNPLGGGVATAVPYGDAAGDLRYCLELANSTPGEDTIEFDTFSGVAELSAALPAVTESVTIRGRGLGDGIDANGTGRVLTIQNPNPAPPIDVTLEGLTLTGGSAAPGLGGAVLADALQPGPASTLTLDRVWVTGNTAFNGGGLYAGKGWVVDIIASTFSGNAALDVGGALSYDDSAVTAVNSTFSGNTASTAGGAFKYWGGDPAQSQLDLVNCTVTDNTAGSGGGLGVTAPSPTVTLLNTVIAGNTAASGEPDVDGDVISLGGNVIGRSAAVGWLASDLVGTALAPVDPRLTALTPQPGSATPVHTPRNSSPLLNRGVAGGGVPATDQLGNARQGGVFAGAVQALELVVTSSADAGPDTLRQAMLDAEAHRGSDRITFDLPAGDRVIAPTSALPTVTDSLVIDGLAPLGFTSGTPVVTLDGSLAGLGVDGLTVGPGGVLQVFGLVVNNFATGAGVLGLAGSVLVLGNNYLGTDVTGTLARPNRDGVRSAGSVLIGLPAAGNLIAGNTRFGVLLEGSADGEVVNNLIGAAGLGNGSAGVRIDGVTVNGAGPFGYLAVGLPDQPGTGNVIAGNAGPGVWVTDFSPDAQSGLTLAVSNNTITGNAGPGVLVDGTSTGVEIGAAFASAFPDPGAGNLIAGNAGAGVAVTAAGVVRVQGNSITGNAGRGIDRAAGPPVPVLTGYDGVTLSGVVRGAAFTQYTVEVAVADTTSGGASQGRDVLGTVVVTTDAFGFAAFTFVVPVALGSDETLVATATDATGDTSASSAGLAVGLVPVGQPPPAAGAGDTFGQVAVRVVDAWGQTVAAAGVGVTFTVQGGGPAATFGGQTSVTVPTDDTGVATAPPLRAERTGTFTLDATAAGLGGASFALETRPGQAVSFVIVGLPPTLTAGATATAAVLAFDAFGNHATDFDGTVALVGPGLPATLTLADGVGVFTLTPTRAGPLTVTAGNASATLAVAPAAAATLRVVGLPTRVVAGTPVAGTVRAFDRFGNLATNFDGPVALAGAPGTARVVLADGVGTFRFTPTAAGPLTVTAGGSAAGAARFVVAPAALATMTLTGPASAAAGQAVTFTLTAADAYGNAIDGRVPVALDADLPTAGLPAAVTFAGGTATMTVTFLDAGTARLTATAGAASAAATATVAPALAATPATFTAFAGTAFSGTVATFTAAVAAPASSFSARIAWGDGTVTDGRVVADGAGFAVLGEHTYAAEDSFDIDVTVTGPAGQSVTVSGPALVFTAEQGEAFEEFAFARSKPGDTTLAVKTGAVEAELELLDPNADVSLFSGSYDGDPQGLLEPGPDRVFVDVRVTNPAAIRRLTVRIDLPPAYDGGPVELMFFDRAAGQYRVVVADSANVDAAARVLVLVLDADSFPALIDLDGTVFTVALATPPTPQAVSVPQPVAVASVNFTIAPAPVTAPATFSTGGQLTLALTPVQQAQTVTSRSQLSAESRYGSNPEDSGEAENPERLEKLKAAFRKLLGDTLRRLAGFTLQPAAAATPPADPAPAAEGAEAPAEERSGAEGPAGDDWAVAWPGPVPLADPPPAGDPALMGAAVGLVGAAALARRRPGHSRRPV